jgi:DNA sulfur modification protein DndD
LQKKIQIKEEEFTKQGGQFYEKREELLASKAYHQNRLENFEKEIRDLCMSTLPFSLVPKQLEETKQELLEDEKKIQNSFEKTILEKNFKELLSEITKNNFASKIDKNSKSQFTKELSEILNEKIDAIPNYFQTTFNFSPADIQKLVQFIDGLKNSGVEKIQTLVKSCDSEIDALNGIQVALESVPKHSEIGPLRTAINQLNRELGHLEEKYEEKKIQESLNRHYLNKGNAAVRINLTKKFGDTKLQRGLELSPKIQKVLEEYSELLRAKKLQTLEENILEGLKMLLHKKDFIEKVKIDKETFEVKLFKGTEDEITKNMLSKGELQMFAIAVVWGLAKTSERPLPFMIDTPLARLDDEHRNNLVENFFPYASHQIIIFSTNSEINPDLYRKLEPAIQNSFLIQYDSEEGKTMKKEGYFFEKLEEKIIEV